MKSLQRFPAIKQSHISTGSQRSQDQGLGFSWSPIALPSFTVAPRRRRCCETGPWLTKLRAGTSTRPEEMVGRTEEHAKVSTVSVRTGGLPALWSESEQEPLGEVALSVQGLAGATLRNLSFEVRHGEIVGIAGQR